MSDWKMKTFDFTRRDRSGVVRTVGRMSLSAAANGAPAKLEFYGDIVSADWERWDSGDACPTSVSEFLGSIDPTEPLDIYFNSGGGDVYAGIAIYNLLMRHTGTMRGYVDGMCASIASVILMCCGDITVNTGAQIMIHNPWTYAWGNAAELRAYADRLDDVRERMLDIYMTRAAEGVTREAIGEKMDAETWLDGAAAAEVFAGIKQGAERMAALVDSDYYAHYLHTPAAVAAAKDDALRRDAALREIIGDLDLYGT